MITSEQIKEWSNRARYGEDDFQKLVLRILAGITRRLEILEMRGKKLK